MISRIITDELLKLTAEYPVVTILGPRQAGKTTLAKMSLAGYHYSNLEAPDVRELAQNDPKAYLDQFPTKTIIDEIQRVPQLLSYIQVLVDRDPENGRFVVTGSHQLQLREAISQSLAGRTAILNLLPLSICELSGAGIEFGRFEDYVWHGFLPRVYDQSLRPATAYSNYYQTYVERDVRQLIRLHDATLFEKLLKLLAGRVGQLLEYSSLANDTGVDAKTVRQWISILEASYVLFRLPPYFENFGKRVTKAPKFYFTDLGLLCFLLGIREPDQVTRDPLVGSIFENLVVMECLKALYNRGEPGDLFYFRDSNGNEVDLLWRSGSELMAAEIKSASTFSMGLMKGLQRFRKITTRTVHPHLIYSGEPVMLSDGTRVLHYKNSGQCVNQESHGCA